MAIKTITWVGGIDGYADMVDQTLLPIEYKRIECRSVAEMWDAIERLVVRGAPAIGVAGAYGVLLGLQEIANNAMVDKGLVKIDQACEYLATSRPTAVNLFWALDRMANIARQASHDSKANSVGELKEILLAEAQAIHRQDEAMCREIGKHGQALIAQGDNVLTHCNAGGLATTEYGTALAVMFAAHEQARRFHVYVDETRPLLQGARLTAWELMQAGIDNTLICDNMAGYLMSQGKIDLVITGADRITANGDTANKIGTYALAVLATAHDIPFYIAAPSSTFDLNLATGLEIPIEQRDGSEITHFCGKQTAPEGVRVYNPAFDVTPCRYIKAIITEKAIIKEPCTESIAKIIGTEAK